MTKEMSNAVQREVVKWAFIALITLVGAGLVTIANRNVYSKEQIDTKLLHRDAVSDLQQQRILERLDEISEDVNTLSEVMMEHRIKDGQ